MVRCGLDRNAECPRDCPGQLVRDRLDSLRGRIARTAGIPDPSSQNIHRGLRRKLDLAIHWVTARCMRAGASPLLPFDKPDEPSFR